MKLLITTSLGVMILVLVAAEAMGANELKETHELNSGWFANGAEHQDHILNSKNSAEMSDGIEAYANREALYSDELELSYADGESIICPQPENLTILEVGSDYAIVSWEEVGTADGWKVKYGPEGHDPNDITQGTWFSTFGSTTFTFPDLEPSTTYEFYAQSNCINPLEDSPWAGPISFTTAGACPVPTDLEVIEIAFGTQYPRVNATWINPENTTDCELRGGRISFPTSGSPNPQFSNVNNTRLVSHTNGSTIDFNIAIYDNPRLLFIPGLYYGFEVRCQCADGSGYSEWSGLSPESTFIVPTSSWGFGASSKERLRTSDQALLTIFPNPSDGKSLSIALTEGTEERVLLRVLDIRGVLVMEKEFRDVKTGYQALLEFENELRTGIYLIQAIQGAQTLQEKFFVE